MFAALKRLILAIVKVGLLDFLRRIGLKWALGLIMTVVAVFLILVAVIVTLLGIILL